MTKLIQRLFKGKPRFEKIIGDFTVTMTELERLAIKSREEEAQAARDRSERREQYTKENERIHAQYLEDQNANRQRQHAAEDEAVRAEKVREKIAELIGEDQ